MTDLSEYSVLLVDDEPAWLHGLSLALERSVGITDISCCNDSRQVMTILQDNRVDLILLDITMPYITGEELLPQIVESYPEIPVIILTGINQVDLSVRCMQLGAFDFFVKSVEQQQLLAGIRRAVKMLRLQQENRQLNQNFLNTTLKHPEAFTEIVSRDPQVLSICKYLEAVSTGPHPILILGESGTGKELFARAVHKIGRPDKPWLALNVAGLDDNVFSDTLFGHVRGAFTGADQTRTGMIESAADGTLFLDEIGDLSRASQVKLLRLLQEGEYLPLGADRPRRSAARIVLATNVDLQHNIESGSFRRDLFYRLAAHQVTLPPLRQRPDDLPLLIDHLIQKLSAELGKPAPDYPAELAVLLGTYHFPGNIRELEGMLINALGTHQKGTLSLSSFRQQIGPAAPPTAESAGREQKLRFTDSLPSLEEAGRLLVEEAMRRAQNNQTIAAALLGISRPGLNKRLKKYRQPS
ncbi:MAG: sigma-54-dependent Fis family transcriptional regulator [Deltaproteobacteria bacterium]|nr:sigma-54-dependent Fis family transcriptional regulator [Deltaproteobacteria bacterium]